VIAVDDRIGKIQERLKTENIDGFLVTCWENKRYLTNFSGSTGWVVVTPDRCIIMIDGRYTEQAAQECPSFVERIHISDFVAGFPKELPATLNQLKLKRLGIEAHKMTLLEARSIEENSGSVTLVSTTGWIEALRIKKSPEEVRLLREAILMGEKACEKGISKVEPDVPEVKIAHTIIDYLSQHGVKESFDTIVASGERSAMPHGRPTERKMKKGDVVVIDMGALVSGYHSDITRTVCIGEPTDEQKKVYELLQKAQEAAYKVIKPGITGKEADAAARKAIQEAGYGDYFSHGLGHGIGLEIHEAPPLRKTGDQVLEEGMVVTVEPGIYMAGKFGMRLEDDVLVTADGCEILTKIPQKLKL